MHIMTYCGEKDEKMLSLLVKFFTFYGIYKNAESDKECDLAEAHYK